MKKITLGVSGMTCSACSSAIERHLSKQDGIASVSINLILNSAMVEYDESKLDKKP